MKNLIFDAGPLINFSMNGLLPLLEKIKKEFKGDFLITKEVKREVIDHPITIKRFELGALRLKQLFDKGIIKHADITPQQVAQLKKKRNEIMNTANSTFRGKGKNIHLIDKGESAALALSWLLKQPSLIVIDERTARMLTENPENLRKLMQKKLRTSIQSNKKNYDYFKEFKVIRSTELIYIAHKKKLIELKDPRAYEAMLYGIKYKGCSVSHEEIQQMKRL
jgi:predicted nucleic acid-binding protein